MNSKVFAVVFLFLFSFGCATKNFVKGYVTQTITPIQNQTYQAQATANTALSKAEVAQATASRGIVLAEENKKEIAAVSDRVSWNERLGISQNTQIARLQDQQRAKKMLTVAPRPAVDMQVVRAIEAGIAPGEKIFHDPSSAQLAQAIKAGWILSSATGFDPTDSGKAKAEVEKLLTEAKKIVGSPLPTVANFTIQGQQAPRQAHGLPEKGTVVIFQKAPPAPLTKPVVATPAPTP
ncbi:MAG: hypothetical protein HY472_01525 [Candidatus Sungbacteria bacterium]|nr:hypothetical protein [Candidatus Sungbacteria bacterium]